MIALTIIILSACTPQNYDYTYFPVQDTSADQEVEYRSSLFDEPSLPGELIEQESYWLHDEYPFYMLAGSGVLVADFNNDGWMDLFLPTPKKDELYLGGENRSFTKASDWITYEDVLSVGGAVADYDGDGDLDIFLAVTQGSDLLLRNEGDHFVDVSFSSGILDIPSDSTCVSWADFDLDGDLDLAVGAHKDLYFLSAPNFPPADPNFVYENMGNGRFQPFEMPFLEREAMTLGVSWLPLQAGERPYLYFVNDSMGAPPDLALPNLLYTWDNGRLTNASVDSGAQIVMAGMGISVGDLNFDQKPDILMSNEGPPVLLMSLEEVTWYDGAISMGLGKLQENQVFSWGTSIADFENDGDLDIWLGYGPVLEESDSNPTYQPDAFLLNEDGMFTDRGADWISRDNSNTRGGLFVDLDKDGNLDLIRSSLEGPTTILYGKQHAGAWLCVELQTDTLNRNAIGARVEVQIGEKTWTNWMLSGSSSSSGGPPVLHFGLGTADTADEIRVYWPTGEESQYNDIPLNRSIVLVQD